VAARQFAMLAVATWALIRFENPLVWIPLAIVQGFTIFNFTILLHEVVHHTIFEKRRQTARAAVDGGKVSGTALDAACDKLYALIEAAAPDNEPVDPYAVARGEMPLSESTPALLELYKRGRLRCFSSAAPGVLVVRARFDRSSAG